MSFIGLTGNFGAGKTTALNLFKEYGTHTISADKLVHEILKKPGIIKKLAVILGEKILTKRVGKVLINKKIMAEMIFSDPKKRHSVELVIHPEALKIAKNLMAKISDKNPGAIIIFEAPLLFEAGLKSIFDKVIVVYCDRETTMRRLLRKGFSRQASLARIRAQMPARLKKSYADYLINNNSDIKGLRIQVRTVLKKLTVSAS